VSPLKELTRLTVLNLADNPFSDVSALKKLQALTRLNLEDNPNLTRAQIEELQRAMPDYCNILHNARE